MGKKFQHRIDEYSKQLKDAEIGPSTVVRLLFEWADSSGNVVYIGREEIEPGTKVQGLGSGALAQSFTKSLHVGTILDNLERRILDAPDGDVPRNIQPSPVHLHDVKLEIIEA